MALHLVTGGAGFIGSHIAQALLERGHRVRVLDDLSSGRLENFPRTEVGQVGSGAPLEFLRGTICSTGDCTKACEGVASVFHEAAQVSVPRSFEAPLESYEINVMGTLRLLEAARRAGVRNFVFAASSAAYGNSPTLPKTETMPANPLSPYASGKLAGEHLLRVYGESFGMKTVALRYFNIFGPRQADDSPYTGVIALFARALLEGRRATIYGDGEQTRDFTYIANVVQANLLALEADVEAGIVINIGGGERISVNALYRAMAEMLDVPLEPIYAPARTGDVRDSLAALDVARARLKYSPSVSWKTGLATTVEWYRERLSAARR
jgi:UDP-N-acetylglucosamine/UDP-N-acetyl-alpha-D-glucosaminouronate 4-epimerase